VSACIRTYSPVLASSSSCHSGCWARSFLFFVPLVRIHPLFSASKHSAFLAAIDDADAYKFLESPRRSTPSTQPRSRPRPSLSTLIPPPTAFLLYDSNDATRSRSSLDALPNLVAPPQAPLPQHPVGPHNRVRLPSPISPPAHDFNLNFDHLFHPDLSLSTLSERPLSMADDPSGDPHDVSNTPLGPHPPQPRPHSFRGGFGGSQPPFQHQYQHQHLHQHQPQSPMHYYPHTSDQVYTLPSPPPYPPSSTYSMMPGYGAPATSVPYTYPTPGYAPWGFYPPIQSPLTSTPQGTYHSPSDESPSSPNPGPPQATPPPQPQSPYGTHSPGYSPLHHPNYSAPTPSAPAYTYSTPMYSPSPPMFNPQYVITLHPLQSPYHTGPHATSVFGAQPSETGRPTDDRTNSQPPRPPLLRQQASQSVGQTLQQQQHAATPSSGSWWFPPGYAVPSAYPGLPNADLYAQRIQVPPHGAAPPVSSQAPPQLPQDPPPAPSGQLSLSIGSPSGASALSPQALRLPPLVSSPSFRPASASSSSFTAAPTPLRRFNPNPATRSEWVLWCGNVPNDATEEELLRFFRQIDSQSPQETSVNVGERVTSIDVALAASGGNNTLPARPSTASSGSAATATTSSVASVFLIARSNCAFINFTSKEALHKAVQKFNGKPLRKGGKCPRLVCRIRRREDDLRAGVGGQRGTGIHVQWVKEMARRQESAEARRWVEDPPTSPSTHLGPESSTSAGDPSPRAQRAEEEGPTKERPAPVPIQSSDSGKSQSTTSSLLGKHFPKRYFILKSLTQVSHAISFASLFSMTDHGFLPRTV
jgi:RNA recognition motif-containing protein